MKFSFGLILAIVLGVLCTSQVRAQNASTALADRATDLRLQLVDVQSREADLQVRLNQLDEDLQPQNIERALAGVGSTRPEELREQRRRALTIERDGVRRQLDLLATSRTLLELAIQESDNRAYQQSAQGFVVNTTRISSLNPRVLVLASVTFFGLLALGGLLFRRRILSLIRNE